MNAVDTNVVVRYLVQDDDPTQSKIAKALIDGKSVFVSATVFLESEWVLRSVYKFANSEIVAALRKFAGLPTVLVEDPARMIAAFAWTEHGIDFADALHVAGAHHCDGFITFDKDLAKSSTALTRPRVKLA